MTKSFLDPAVEWMIILIVAKVLISNANLHYSSLSLASLVNVSLKYLMKFKKFKLNWFSVPSKIYFNFTAKFSLTTISLLTVYVVSSESFN